LIDILKLLCIKTIFYCLVGIKIIIISPYVVKNELKNHLKLPEKIPNTTVHPKKKYVEDSNRRTLYKEGWVFLGGRGGGGVFG
jgi:hypothetical protein